MQADKLNNEASKLLNRIRLCLLKKRILEIKDFQKKILYIFLLFIKRIEIPLFVRDENFIIELLLFSNNN